MLTHVGITTYVLNNYDRRKRRENDVDTRRMAQVFAVFARTGENDNGRLTINDNGDIFMRFE